MRQKLCRYILMLAILLSWGMAYATPVELITNGTFDNLGLGDSNGGNVDPVGVPGWTSFGDYNVKIINTLDSGTWGSTGPRPGASDPYFVRGGSRGATQVVGGEANLRSIPFVIPVGTTKTKISFWWEFFTFDSIDKDHGMAVVKADSTTVVANLCGDIGGTSRGGLEQYGWTNCIREYDSSILMPGEDYFLRFKLLTTDDTSYASWGYIDDVSVLASVQVPEPNTVWLIGMGIAFLGIPLVKNRFHKKDKKGSMVVND